MQRIGLIAACVVLTAASLARPADWPQFRGPLGLGITSNTGLPTTWGPNENIKWKVPMPNKGNGSPIVSQGKVFVIDASQDGKQRSLFCFDRRDGKQNWERSVPFDQVEPTHQTNPFGASTPAADGRRVVVWHGSAGLFCYDFEGKELWSTDLGDVLHIWGYGSSPIIHNDKAYLNFGPGEQTFMVAVDLNSGETIWKTEEPGGNNDRQGRIVGSWSTPIVANINGSEQILCSMPTRVVAYDPQNGSILWTCDGLPSSRGDLVYTSLIVNDTIGVAMGGFKGPAMGFRLGGSGDVTKTNRLWRVEQAQPQRIGSGVILGNYVYIANAGPSTVQCLELDTGREVWESRIQGDACWGSTILADGRLYVTDQQGTTHVFRPSPEKFDLIASNRLGETCNATPAFADQEIFIRTDRQLYCIGEN